LLGSYQSGKTSITTRYVAGTYNDSVISTIGASFLTKTVQLDSSEQIKFEIWDTSGQARFATLAPMYYRGARAIIIVYDLTSKTSFKEAQDRVREMKLLCNEAVVALVGNKIDLESAREVSTEEGMSFAKSNSVLFYETSAKTNQNIDLIFITMAERIDDLPQDIITKTPVIIATHDKTVNR